LTAISAALATTAMPLSTFAPWGTDERIKAACLGL
jgi:hypothetical protein